jgi:hypothetical protein
MRAHLRRNHRLPTGRGQWERLRALAVLLAITLVVSPRPARAEPADAKTVARDKALEGSRVADQGQHERALELFREAYALYPEPAYLYDMGVEFQALGRDVEALDAYGRFLRDPHNTPRSLVTHASELQAELEKRVGEIQLRGAPEGAEIEIDDQPRGTAPPREPMRAKPGLHRVVVRRSGYEPFRTDVQVPEGGPVLVDVGPLAPSEPAFSPSSRPKPWLSWTVSLGAGFWTAGPPEGTGPSPTFSLGGGRVLAALATDLDFELGAKFGLTYFTEPTATNTFVSVLANPRLVRSFGERLRAFADVGIGLLVLSGVPDNSVLLEPAGGRVTGALAAFELRPAVGLTYALTDALSCVVAPAFVWNPSPSERFQHASLTRVELALGLMGDL